MDIISCQDISFTYKKQAEKKSTFVFENLDFEVSRGQFVSILGHNGSGKSTLAKHFNAILLPSGGKVYINGMDTLDEEKTFEIRSHVGMVFQNPDNQLVATVVEEDVAFALENMGVESSEIRRRVDEALKKADMYEYREHAPHQLSGGQKQRVAIAGVIAMRPDCIVLDEPTAMLDPQGRKEVMQTLKSLVADEDITVILITHYMEEAAQTERVVVMDSGRIIFDGKPIEVFSHVEELQKVELDVPQSSELIYELKKSGINLPKYEITREATVEMIANTLEHAGVKKIGND